MKTELLLEVFLNLYVSKILKLTHSLSRLILEFCAPPGKSKIYSAAGHVLFAGELWSPRLFLSRFVLVS